MGRVRGDLPVSHHHTLNGLHRGGCCCFFVVVAAGSCCSPRSPRGVVAGRRARRKSPKGLGSFPWEERKLTEGKRSRRRRSNGHHPKRGAGERSL